MRKIGFFILAFFTLISCSSITVTKNTQVPTTVKKTTQKKVVLPEIASIEEPSLKYTFQKSELKLDITKDILDEIPFEIPVTMTPKVKRFIKYYTKTNRKLFQRWLDRSNKYIYLSKDIFRRHGLPEELVCLAFAESGFNPHAYSRAGAGGMWQFMPATGKAYNLKINKWVDERRDFEKSTVAAAKFLKYLHNYYGDWYLAIASYNAGFYKIKRAVKKYDSNDFFELAKHPYLKNETKSYVPKFLALMIIHNNYLEYGFRPPNTEPLLYDNVKIDKQINLYTVAQLIDTDISVLKELNPALKLPFTPPNTAYKLKVPYGKKEDLVNKISKLSKDELLQVKIYKAKKGQYVKSIAKKFNASEKEIKDINGLRYSKILYNHDIYIPIKKYFNYSYYKSFAKDVRKKAPKVHIVKRGDNFYNIAHKYGLSLYDLIRLNQGINYKRIRPGQAIIVSYDYKSRKKYKKPKAKKHYKLKSGKYVVRQGDTLWDIAKYFNTSISVIMAKNNLNSSNLRPGKVLIITN